MLYMELVNLKNKFTKNKLNDNLMYNYNYSLLDNYQNYTLIQKIKFTLFNKKPEIDLLNDCELNLPIDQLNNISTKKDNYPIRIVVHILLHIILLSTLESFIFFFYISKNKNKSFLGVVKNYFNYFHKIIINEEYNNYITFDNNINLDNYLIELNQQSNNNFIYRNLFNNKLKIHSFFITFILSSIFIIYISLTYRKYNLYLKKLFFEHITLILLIGAYEIWFFQNIILHYKSITMDELNYMIVKCTLYTLNNNIKNIHINSTLINNCELI